MSLDAQEVLRKVRASPIKFVPGRRVVSIYPGEWPSPFEGKGFEPLRFRDFEIGDDPRRIHAPSTARRGIPTVGERVALRDFRILVVVDCSASMKVREKAETQFVAAALLLYSAWQAETTFELAVQDGEQSVVSYGSGIGSRHFYALFHVLRAMLLGEGSRPRGRSLALGRARPPSTMVFYFSDFLAPGGDLIDVSAFWRRVRRYDLIPVVIQDAFECSFPALPGNSFIPFANPETGETEELWLSAPEVKGLRSANEERFLALRDAFERHGARLVHLMDADMQRAGRSFNAYFRQRPRR